MDVAETKDCYDLLNCSTAENSRDCISIEKDIMKGCYLIRNEICLAKLSISTLNKARGKIQRSWTNLIIKTNKIFLYYYTFFFSSKVLHLKVRYNLTWLFELNCTEFHGEKEGEICENIGRYHLITSFVSRFVEINNK